jgi:hypothetical protein
VCVCVCVLRVYLSARQGDGDNGAMRTCYHGYQSHQLLNSLFHSFRRKLEVTREGKVEAEAKCCMRCLCVCVCVCVFVCVCAWFSECHIRLINMCKGKA